MSERGAASCEGESTLGMTAPRTSKLVCEAPVSVAPVAEAPAVPWTALSERFNPGRKLDSFDDSLGNETALEASRMSGQAEETAATWVVAGVVVVVVFVVMAKLGSRVARAAADGGFSLVDGWAWPQVVTRGEVMEGVGWVTKGEVLEGVTEKVIAGVVRDVVTRGSLLGRVANVMGEVEVMGAC